MANFVEKENLFVRIAKYLFPQKGDSITEILRKIIFMGAGTVLIVSVVILLITAGNKVSDTSDNNSLSDIYHGAVSGNTAVNIDTTKREELKKEYPEVLEEFLPLLEINKDVVGWITVENGEKKLLDYVVMQTDNNDYYLDHNYKGEESISGAIFADYHDEITAESQPANIVLYGHNMMSGEYFAQLTRFNNYHPAGYGLDYIKSYPTITFSTLYKKSTYKIFGGVLINTRKEEGAPVFNYIRYRNFDTKADFDDYCAKILDRSTFINPDANLKYGDNLLTLSTCSLQFDADRQIRWVIFAREVREGESPEVDVDRIYANPDPLYFDYYYDLYGGEWGGRKWSAELIQGFSY